MRRFIIIVSFLVFSGCAHLAQRESLIYPPRTQSASFPVDEELVVAVLEAFTPCWGDVGCQGVLGQFDLGKIQTAMVAKIRPTVGSDADALEKVRAALADPFFWFEASSKMQTYLNWDADPELRQRFVARLAPAILTTFNDLVDVEKSLETYTADCISFRVPDDQPHRLPLLALVCAKARGDPGLHPAFVKFLLCYWYLYLEERSLSGYHERVSRLPQEMAKQTELAMTEAVKTDPNFKVWFGYFDEMPRDY